MANGERTKQVKNPILEAPATEADLRQAINESSGAKAWETGKSFKVNQFTIFSQILYRCVVNHVSDDFAVDLASTFWEDVTGGGAPGAFIHGEVTTFANLPSAAVNPGKRYFVNTTTGIIGFRNLNGIYRSDGASWIYQGYDRLASSVKTRYESNPDTNAFTDSEQTIVANSSSHQADTNNPHSTDIDGVTPQTTKGDLIVHDGVNALRLPVGANSSSLVADSAQPSGLRWKPMGASRMVAVQGGISSVGGNATNQMSHGHNAAVAPVVFPITGRIFAISIGIDQVQSGGICDAQVLHNGVALTAAGQFAQINGTDQQFAYAIFPIPVEIVAGDDITAQTVTVGFSPTGSDASIVIFVEVDF